MNVLEIQKIIEKDIPDNEKALEIFIGLLPKQQQNIFNLIPFGEENAIDCKRISFLTDIETKNISSQINQINDKSGLVKRIKTSKGFKYYKDENRF